VIYPRVIYNTPKSIQASVTILENLHLIIEKTKPEDVTTDIMPMLFYSFDGSTIQVQVSAAPLGYANHSGTGKWKWVWRSWLCNYGSNFLINCDSEADSEHKSARASEFAFSFRKRSSRGETKLKFNKWGKKCWAHTEKSALLGEKYYAFRLGTKKKA